jgi:hypothetical protein
MATTFSTDFDKAEAIDETKSQIDTQQQLVDEAYINSQEAYRARQSARSELNAAKSDLLDATTSQEEAAARTQIQQAQQSYDFLAAQYSRAVDYRNEQDDKLTSLNNQLADIEDSIVDATQDLDNQELAGNENEFDGEEEELDQDEQDNLDNNEEDGDSTEPQLLNRDDDVEPATGYISDSEQIASGAKTITPISTTEKYVPRANPLHRYATYTYSIALFILTRYDINQLTTDPTSWVPGKGAIKTCLIASGGKNDGQYARNDFFTEDFYFSDLKMTTVIGLNSRSKSSNAIEITFGVQEPYGMSLLDRIIAASTQIKAPNFKAMPYLLEIDFYGYDDAGNSTKIETQRKRIPIQIIEMKIKAGTKGSEYAIKAVPWAHQAFSQSAATTPINIEVKASTVGEFFYNNIADQLAVSTQDAAKMSASSTIQRKEAEQKAADDTDRVARQDAATQAAIAEGVTPEAAAAYKVSPAARKPNDSEATAAKGVVNRAFAVSSYCGGINAWYTDLLIKKLRGTVDRIAFNVHDDIAKTKIVTAGTKDITRSAVKDDKPAAAAASAAKEANRVFTDAQAFPISAGTSVTQVIDMVMRNSEYITSQIKDPKNMSPQELAEKEGKVLNWYRVIPTVALGEYDYAMNKFSTTTTYHIMPYKVYDSKHPNGPSAAPKGSIKKYSYSYTGKNTDILDFQIDFDTLFYTAVTAGAAKWQAEMIQTAAQQKDDSAKVAADSAPAAADLVNRQLRLVPSQPQSTGGGGTQNGAKTILAGDVQKSLYSSSRGDMLNLKLKITGDPELIKQDDVYTNPAQADYEEQIKTKELLAGTGSVAMDNGEIMAEVEFRTIIDMNPATGLPAENPEYSKNSQFTGLYRMLTVENVFANGKFEQTIDMVRMPDAVNSATNNADQGQNTARQTNNNTDSNKAPGTRSIESDDTSTEQTSDPTPIDNDVEETGPSDADIEQADQVEIVDDTGADDPDADDLARINDSSPVVSIDEYRDEESVAREPSAPASTYI